MPIRSLIGGQYRPMSDDDIRQIHEAVLTVFAEVGVRVEHRPALEIFEASGCQVDFDKHIVYVPEEVLSRALTTAPSAFTLHGKAPEFDVSVNLQDVYTIGGSSALSVLDLDGARRDATMRDLVDLTRLLDAQENLHIMHALVVPGDIPQPGFDRRLFSTVVANTRRNYYSQGQGGRSIREQVEMAAVVQGSVEAVRRAPIFTIVCCLISPLVQTGERVEEIIECAKLGIPVYIEVDSMAGSTTPMTVAGTLVEECANVLCGVVLAQLVNPGTPCIFAIASGIANPANLDYSGAAPETALIHAATAQMAHFYGLPFQGGTGIDATLPDAQAGYERALQVLTCALAGVNFIHLSLGMMEQMLLASYEQCLIDDEIIGAAFRIVRGFEVNADTIGLDVIREVGPGGNYLAEPHSVKYLRSDRWMPKLTNRDRWGAWMARGGLDMRQRANARAREILTGEREPIITPEQEAELERMALDYQAQVMHGR